MERCLWRRYLVVLWHLLPTGKFRITWPIIRVELIFFVLCVRSQNQQTLEHLEGRLGYHKLSSKAQYTPLQLFTSRMLDDDYQNNIFQENVLVSCKFQLTIFICFLRNIFNQCYTSGYSSGTLAEKSWLAPCWRKNLCRRAKLFWCCNYGQAVMRSCSPKTWFSIFFFCGALTSKSNSLKIPLWTIFPNEILCGFAENKPIFYKNIIITPFFLSYKSLW